jgi:hypothetical protein
MEDANSMTVEWSAMFKNADIEAQKKDDLRKVYDHYEKKLENMYENRDIRVKKGTDTQKDIEKLVRVLRLT